MADKRPRMRRPTTVSSILSGVFTGTPAAERLREGQIWVVWEDAVGPGIAAHAHPVSFRDGTLTLAVESAPWMQQLTYLKREIIAKVNEALREPMVRDLYLKAGRVKPAPPPPPERKRRPLTEEEIQWANEQANSLEDPELRAVFERLIKRDLENR
ncbi:DUF721 domain-containing protein [Geomesophilobacter sediminis]|uniref:DUF721 domain-containing protein n=1 Tax=Geomesophilobacter sediminis TaxID=2798584 RepID=A0A8J7M1P4_9BACT|nr:DUF721 domain-containing protein [Geomesophilobacter sediminis]MBJ6727039.1 DUF721 domain-containing protein [Geomesophilobacter sediminis]